MRILGLDPGVAEGGCCVYDTQAQAFIAAYAIRTKPENGKRKGYAADDFIRRMRLVARQLANIMHAHDCRAIISEAASRPRYNAGQRMLAAGIAISVAVAELSSEAPIYTLSPQEIKVALTNRKDASKAAVAAAVEAACPGALDLLDGPASVHNHQTDSMAAVLAARGGPELRLLLGGI
jgi:Holliday junction resolvasome RuvABC endonuclease subunit